ncbi:hypothetical protein ACFYXQ_02500 [Nocardia jiangxiensis]|uniref:Uncharacterized protein n=1 Tax=Nocardia jiangxiensis TaxID=282685 RepID=A0ABW6RUI6_9NOCA
MSVGGQCTTPAEAFGHYRLLSLPGEGGMYRTVAQLTEPHVIPIHDRLDQQCCRPWLAGRGFDSAPGLHLAVVAEPVIAEATVDLTTGRTLHFIVPVPESSGHGS